MTQRRYLSILFNIPNIIGYVRIFLLVLGCLLVSEAMFIFLVILSAFLDMFDGILARKFRQETTFGDWLDIVIDLFTRGMLWCWSLPHVGFLIMGFEFLIFVCLHSRVDSNDSKGWQETKKIDLHFWAAKTISKGFKTLPGSIAIIGLWVLPIWVYMSTRELSSALLVDIFGFTVHGAASLEFFVTAFLMTSRFHCAFAELCILKNHIVMLLEKNT